MWSPWLGILTKSSLSSECVKRACVRWKLHVFAINMSSSAFTYTLGFSRGGVRNNDSLCAFEHRIRALVSV